MRPIVFLFPHDQMDIGGNSAQVRFVDACRTFASVETAFYGERIPGKPHLDDYLDAAADRRPVFVIHWGPDIAMLLAHLTGRDVVYVAHSTGWGMALPSTVPILCVSRHTMAYWGRYAPNSYIALVPNIVDAPVCEGDADRDIDVLVQVRKSSRYLLDRLAPALQDRCRVQVLDGWVDDLSAWFRRSKVYLYDSLEHWVDVGATEGFGLPPLEALAQGCVVFSSMNDALSDYLDPGFNCRKIRVHSLAWDVSAILAAVSEQRPAAPPRGWFSPYDATQVAGRLERVFCDLGAFFDLSARQSPDIEDLWESRRPTPLQRAKRAVRVLAGA